MALAPKGSYYLAVFIAKILNVWKIISIQLEGGEMHFDLFFHPDS